MVVLLETIHTPSYLSGPGALWESLEFCMMVSLL